MDKLQVGAAVFERLKELPPTNTEIGNIYGVPVILDESLAPDEWALVKSTTLSKEST